MITTYLKTAWRTLQANRAYALTNIIGLTVGLTVFMLISTRLLDEWSHDQHWSHKNELYRIQTNYKDYRGNASMIQSGFHGIATLLEEDIPEITHHTHAKPSLQKLLLDSLEGRFAELELLITDTGFFNLFDTQALDGSPKQLAHDMKGLVLTESTYQRLFKGEDVIGKVLHTVGGFEKSEPYRIQAIIQDLPNNSHIKAEGLVLDPQRPVWEPEGSRGYTPQYIRVRERTDTAALTKKINAWYQLKKSLDESTAYQFSLQSVKDIHLRTTTGWNSPMRNVYLMGGIALLTLILVAINFINLTYAHAVKRSLESGVRKVLGAERKHFFYQFGVESLFLFGGSFLVAYILYLVSLPAYEQFLDQPLTVVYHRSVLLTGSLLVFWLSLGMLCCLFPAMSLSRTKISQGLRRQLSFLSLPLSTGFTRGLVTIQFSIAITVVICMLTIGAQLRFIKNKDLGFEPADLLVTVNLGSWEGKAASLKQELLKHASIARVSFSQWTPFAGSVDFYPIPDPNEPENQEKTQMMAMVNADSDFLETMGIRMKEGRDLNPSALQGAPSVGARHILVNESTAKAFGIKLEQYMDGADVIPVGIIADFHASNLRYPIGHMAISSLGMETLSHPSFFGILIVKVVTGKEVEAEKVVTDAWKQAFPDKLLPDMHWMDEKIQQQYVDEQKQFQQLVFFGSISMLIALLGVLGLAIYTIERKVKEIGIRKVLGASVSSIVSLLSWSFTKPVLLALVLAFPIAWWMMGSWLDNFAYRIEMPVHLFILAGLLALACMLALVGWQASRAAMANPVDSLRDE